MMYYPIPKRENKKKENGEYTESLYGNLIILGVLISLVF